MASYNLGPLEKEVMDCIWERGDASVGEIQNCLKKSRKIAYTTVMTIMTRLEKKGFLTRVKKGRFYIYTPRESKSKTAKGVVKNILDSLVNQYGEEAVTAFTDELRKYK